MFSSSSSNRFITLVNNFYLTIIWFLPIILSPSAAFPSFSSEDEAADDESEESDDVPFGILFGVAFVIFTSDWLLGPAFQLFLDDADDESDDTVVDDEPPSESLLYLYFWLIK